MCRRVCGYSPLPLAAQTAQTGTLAAFMSHLGISVEEVDLDAESNAESDVDSARCGMEDDEMPQGVYRDADGKPCWLLCAHNLDDHGPLRSWYSDQIQN